MTIPSTAAAWLALASLPPDLRDPYPYPDPAWSPYLVGALIGLLLLLTLAAARKKIGASSAYMSLAGLIGRVTAPRHVASLERFRKDPPAIGWTLVFVLSAIGGSFLAAWSGGELTGTYLQDLWVARFGAESHLLRTVVAFAGGAVMVAGARIAGGCTSGHGISGTAQLAVGSWIALIAFFVGGIAIAWPLYRL
jgi:hypothetical protein